MRPFLMALAASASALLVSPSALAQRFFESGEISVALERGFGIHYSHQEIETPDGEETDTSGTVIGIGWYGALTPLHWTRAALDVFVVDQLSVGGSLAFFSQSGDPDFDGLLLSPRVGYAIPLSKAFVFWPRGGFTHYDLEDSLSYFGLAGEAMFVASPRDGWGILFGATLDLGLSGEAGDDNDFSEVAFGMPSVGLLGTF